MIVFSISVEQGIPLAVGGAELSSLHPGEQCVVLVLQSASSAVVGIHEADDVGSEVLVRITPGHGSLHHHAVVIQFLKCFYIISLQTVCQLNQVVLVFKFLLELLLAEPGVFRQVFQDFLSFVLCNFLILVQTLRIHVQLVFRYALCQRIHIGIIDCSTHRVDGGILILHLRRLLIQIVSPNNLPIGQPEGQHRKHQHHQHESDAQPTSILIRHPGSPGHGLVYSLFLRTLTGFVAHSLYPQKTTTPKRRSVVSIIHEISYRLLSLSCPPDCCPVSRHPEW